MPLRLFYVAYCSFRIWRAGRPSVDDSNREAAEELLNDVKEVCTEFVEKSASVFARSALVDVLEFEGDRAAITKATEVCSRTYMSMVEDG